MPVQTISKKTDARAKKLSSLISQLNAAWFLPNEDKQFWIDNMNNMPDSMLDAAAKAIKQKNELVDRYLTTALEQDKNHTIMAELKNKVLSLKKKAFAIDESSEKGKIEEQLSKELKDIDA